jgi:hypothetical protein
MVAVTALAKRFIWLAAESRSTHLYDMVGTSNNPVNSMETAETVQQMSKKLQIEAAR